MHETLLLSTSSYVWARHTVWAQLQPKLGGALAQLQQAESVSWTALPQGIYIWPFNMRLNH